jgi:hypothetical protein
MSQVLISPVIRQIVARTENSAIPRCDELSSTHTLNQEFFAGHTYIKDAMIRPTFSQRDVEIRSGSPIVTMVQPAQSRL